MFNNYLDFFTQTALIKAIAATAYTPGQIGEMGIFRNESLTGTQLALEEQPDTGAALVTSTPRGTPSGVATLERRKVHTFNTSHYRKDGAVYADEVLNARSAGAAAAGEVIETRRNDTLQRLRRDIDLTLENLRLNAILSPNNAFGNKPSDNTLAVQTDATKTRAEIYKQIIAPIEAALGGIPFSGIKVLCSSGWWENLLGNKEIREAYIALQATRELTGDGRDSVIYGGVEWVRYRGAGTTVITTNKAVAIPVGVPDMFVQAFAPADTLDQVGRGALGQPYYVSAYPIDSGNRGWRLEVQSNPVMVCTRPAAVQTLKIS